MRNIQSTGVFDQPTLVEIKAAMVDKKRLSEFSLVFAMRPTQLEQNAKLPASTVARPPATGTVTKG
jgi:hypothetical protein